MNRKVINGLKGLLLTMMFITVACGGGGGGSDDATGITPVAPSQVSATEGVYTSKVDITWSQVDGAEYYVLYKSIDNRNQFRAVATNITGQTYTDEKVTPNRVYYYRVASGSGETWSDPSADARGFAHSGTPMAAETVTASAPAIGQITINWSTVPQTDSYKVLRSTTEDGTYTEIATGVTTTTYTDSDAALVRNNTYYYKIVSVSNTDGESEPSAAISGVALQDIPAAPDAAGVTATNGTYSNKVDVAWSTVTNAVTYKIYRAPDVSGVAGTYELIAENVTALLFEDTTGEIDVLYHYSVTAVSSGGESAMGGDATGKRETGAAIQTAAPENVAATDGGYNTITVSWNAVDGATSYTIYRSTSATGTYTVAGTSTTTSFVNTPPALETHYFYKVTAWSTGSTPVESFQSLYDEGYAMPEIPAVPANVSATDDHQDATIVITWNAAARAVTYKLYRAEAAGGTYNLLASGLTVLTYTDAYPSISVGKKYYYKVTAVNVSGESAMSANNEGNTVMAKPTGVTINDIGSKARKITWNAVVGATSYEVDHAYRLVAGTPGDSDWTTTTVTATECSFTGLTTTRYHYFRVRAVNAYTESANSSTVDVYIYSWD